MKHVTVLLRDIQDSAQFNYISVGSTGFSDEQHRIRQQTQIVMGSNQPLIIQSNWLRGLASCVQWMTDNIAVTRTAGKQAAMYKYIKDASASISERLSDLLSK